MKLLLLILLASTSMLFAEIKLKRPQFVKKNVGNVIDIELSVTTIKPFSVLSLVKPSPGNEARDGHFQIIKGHENILLGIIRNLHNFGRIEVRKNNVLVLKNIRIENGLTIHISDDTLLLFKQEKVVNNWSQEQFRKFKKNQNQKHKKLQIQLNKQHNEIEKLKQANIELLKILGQLKESIVKIQQQVAKPSYGPRLVAFDMSFDIPTDKIAYVVTISPIDYPMEKQVIVQGDRVSSGTYNVDISMPGYNSIAYNLEVKESSESLLIKQVMYAKERKLAISIAHDVMPHEGDSYKVTLSPVNTKEIYEVSDGKSILPGWYNLDVQQSGYNFVAKKKIHIKPSDDVYTINQSLLAKTTRQLSFDIKDKLTGVTITPHQITNINIKTSNFQSAGWYPTGENHFRLTFKKYKTIEVKVNVYPGDSLLVVRVPSLTPWQKLEFNISTNEITFDNILYKYTFLVDEGAIEKHHLTLKVQRSYHYTVMLPPNANRFKMHAGFLYTERTLNELRQGANFGRLDHLSVPKLINHLKAVVKKDVSSGDVAALRSLEGMMRTRLKRKIRNSTEKKQLILYMKSLQLYSYEYRTRLRILMYNINRY